MELLLTSDQLNDGTCLGWRLVPTLRQVGGRGAVSSTVANTKQSVIQLQRRSAEILSRSERGGVSDFSSSSAGPSGSSGSKLNRLHRIGRKPSAHSEGGSISQERSGHGTTGEPWEASSVDDSQPAFTSAYGGPAPPQRDGQAPDECKGNLQGVREDAEKPERKTLARKIGAFLTALPLSKLKIVIGKPYLRTA